MSDRYFSVSTFKPAGWTHVVFSFIVTSQGEGIQVLYNGRFVGLHSYESVATLSNGNRRILIGRFVTGVSDTNHHASVQVDELVFFNEFYNSAVWFE